MTRLRSFFALSLLFGGFFAASPALAGPYHHAGGLRQVVREQRVQIERLAAERDAACAHVERLQAKLARTPSPAAWADAQAQIASLEQQLVDARRQPGYRLRQRVETLRQELAATRSQLAAAEAHLAETDAVADRRRRRLDRLRSQLDEANARIVRLENRLAARASGYRRHSGRPVVVVEAD